MCIPLLCNQPAWAGYVSQWRETTIPLLDISYLWSAQLRPPQPDTGLHIKERRPLASLVCSHAPQTAGDRA